MVSTLWYIIKNVPVDTCGGWRGAGERKKKSGKKENKFLLFLIPWGTYKLLRAKVA